MNIKELRDGLAYVEALLTAMHTDAEERSLTDDEQTRWDEGAKYVTDTRKAIADYEARAELVAQAAERGSDPGDANARPAGFQVKRNDAGERAKDIDVRTAPFAEVREAAMRAIERADKTYLGSIGDQRADALERSISRGRNRNYDSDRVARSLVATSSEAYERAFIKGISGAAHELTPEEARALSEARAMSIGTDTAGGFGVPVVIDPTIMITNGQSRNPLIAAARVEAITNDEWKGVTAGHTAWSMDAEAAEVSDDTSTFAQPTIATEKPQALIPYSIEVGMDYPGFASEMGAVLSQGYTYLVANQLAVGDGSSPNTTGLFVGTTTTIDVATDNTFVAADVDSVYAGVPEDFRAAGSWVMNVDVENEIRAFGSGTATSRFTVDQTAGGITLLNGKPVILTDHAPAWSATDGQNILVFGDLQNFVVAQRVGMTVELVQHMFATGANRPNGQRGLYAYARFGSGVPVVNAFRRLKNITT